ncbi:flagellin [Natranaerovirga pectinivora]|uniref:Flagellin n=1 Tax=Natranaerovirga pectinivora TaxID=682400 RepID=A0A4R3MJ85_9FIRM|nr:flagellin [Natranaerovirga pectinivora]TCT14019.1 flagellin [Natranaerovirga pectinivora]
MRINNNLQAMNTHRQLGMNNLAASKSTEKLSSGFRINRAADDAAGLAVSEKMRAQIKGLNQASRNAQDGISLIQTAEGALNETHAILQRMRELAVQSANGALEDNDRTKINTEFTALQTEVTRISSDTKFNEKSILNSAQTINIHVGADADQTIAITLTDNSATGLSINGQNISTSTAANTAITSVNTAIGTLNTNRANLGAVQNRLEHTIKNLDNASENLQAAESRIRDVDMAREMMEFTKQNILSQAATAMLAQANQAPQGVLQLLR